MHLPASSPGKIRLISSLTLLATLLPLVPATAAEAKRISVTGTGTVKVRPDVVEIHGIVLGQAELAAEALKKLRDSRRRAAETVVALKIEGLTFTSSGRSVQSPNSAQQMQMIVSGQEGETPVATHVMFYESVTLQLAGIDKLDEEKRSEILVKIIDAAKDAALIIGPNMRNAYMPNTFDGFDVSDGNAGSLVTYRISKPEAAQQKAQELAAKDARAKADRLAALLGVKVGGVHSATEAFPRTESQYSPSMYYAQIINAMQGVDLDANLGAGSGKSEVGKDREIPITATLQVEYEIAP